jgi:ribonuclease HI
MADIKHINKKTKTDTDYGFLYFDGGSTHNGSSNSDAGSGFVITDVDNKTVAEGMTYLGKATNNIAEYTGLYHGLALAVKCGFTKLLVKGDSELVIKQMTGKYKVKNIALFAIYEKAKALEKEFDFIEYVHIPREDNGKADALSRKARADKMSSESRYGAELKRFNN